MHADNETIPFDSNQINVLVTGIGGGVGQSIIKALQGTQYRVVGVDSEKLATGAYAVPIAYMGYYARDPNYIKRLFEIACDEKCKLVFVGHDVELNPISEHIEKFRSRGIIPVVSYCSRLVTEKLQS